MKEVKMRDGAMTDREQRGLLIRERFEMTADLCGSIIQVPCHCSGTPTHPHPPVLFVLQDQTKIQFLFYLFFMPLLLKCNEQINKKDDRPLITF